MPLVMDLVIKGKMPEFLLQVKFGEIEITTKTKYFKELELKEQCNVDKP